MNTNSSENKRSILGPITDNLIDSFVDELKKKKNRDKIMKNIVEPILTNINNRYFPHMMTLTVLLAVIIILLTWLLIANTKERNCQVQQHQTTD